MAWNNAHRVVACRARCGNLTCICEGAWHLCTRCGRVHRFDTSTFRVSCICVNLNAQLIWSEESTSNIGLKEVLAVVRLNSHRTKSHSVPMPIDILLPLQQTYAKRYLRLYAGGNR